MSTGPAIDIVGFGHTPETDAQQSTVTQALAGFKTATAWFHGDSPGKLMAASVLLFKSYPGVTSLRVQMMTLGSQTSDELTPDESILTIKPENTG